jgi:Na+-translocating ferredoxin:NAD+ oxidoreductase RnfD subunit
MTPFFLLNLKLDYMKIKKLIQWLIPITFLSCFTACITAFPETLEEFIWAGGFAFLFWGSMFMGALIDDCE